MNEQIRELAKETGIYDCLCDPYDKYNTGDAHGSVMDDLERFAELIIQDCVAVCDAYGMPDGTSPTAALLSAAIKRKFGIEDVNESLRRRSTYFGNNP
jgi:hypothetical protein